MSRRAKKVALLALALSLPSLQVHAAPSTFGPVIGSALLCRSHLDSGYFYAYLQSAFGPSYKHEGGAYWFKAPDASLWGAPVSEVMVSDDTSPLVFVAAVADTSPDMLEQAIEGAAGIRHRARDASRFPLRVSNPGSTIAYFNNRSKIYCARFKPLPAGR
jgi:hypothetical protein